MFKYYYILALLLTVVGCTVKPEDIKNNLEKELPPAAKNIHLINYNWFTFEMLNGNGDNIKYIGRRNIGYAGMPTITFQEYETIDKVNKLVIVDFGKKGYRRDKVVVRKGDVIQAIIEPIEYGPERTNSRIVVEKGEDNWIVQSIGEAHVKPISYTKYYKAIYFKATEIGIKTVYFSVLDNKKKVIGNNQYTLTIEVVE